MSHLYKPLLQLGTAVPVLYFLSVLLGSFGSVEYSHTRQMVSELGMAHYPAHLLFNGGIFLAGLAAVGAGWGFFRMLSGIGAPVAGAVTGASISMLGAAFIIGALFPLPDPLHPAYGVGLAIHVAPLSLLLALRGETGYRWLKRYLAVCVIAMTALLMIMMDVGGYVTEHNFGVVQRLYALAAFPWIGVAGYIFHRASSAAALSGAGRLLYGHPGAVEEWAEGYLNPPT
jgi:glucan biosynthesis protein C